MAWTDPLTWTTNQTVTSSQMNTHVRDNLKAIAHPYDYAPADVDVANTVTETSIYSKLITGGDMGANGSLHLLLRGDLLYNNSGADTLTLRVKFGGSSIFAAGGSLNGLSANRQPFLLDIVLGNRGATNAQVMYGEWVSNIMSATAPTTGIGSFPDTSIRNRGIFGVASPAAVDTTADQTFQITMQWSAANANNSIRKRLAILTLGQN